MSVKVNKKIRFQKTKGELQVISNSLEKIGKTEIKFYLRQEINRLLKKLEEDPDIIVESPPEDKITLEFYIPLETYQSLLVISTKMKKPVSTILDEFFIIPLQKTF